MSLGLSITSHNKTNSRNRYLSLPKGLVSSYSTSFTGNKDSVEKQTNYPFINPKRPKNKRDTGSMPDISLSLINEIEWAAYREDKTTNDWLRDRLKLNIYTPAVEPVESKNAIVGNTKVHTLIDGKQIFDKTLQYLREADKSIQVEMFEFQNLTIDGDIWKQNGAEKVPGAEEQQQILNTLIKKKQTNPNMKIQIILDTHKWYIDGRGNRAKHFANKDMIKYLKEKGIDVVPYPRRDQQGSNLQHVKLLVTDSEKYGKRAIVGGMNWGTHSAANHDACVALETLENKKNSEVDNIMNEVFNPDWKFSWQRVGTAHFAPGPLSEDEQKYYNGVNKEIKPENVEYARLVGELYDNPKDRERYEDGRLDLIEANPVDDPMIKILATKPREMSEVGEEGKETTREYLMEKLKTCKKVRAELFVLTDKELVEIIIKRVKAGELDAQFVFEPSIKEQFPYCENAYEMLKENDIPVRIYKVDRSINQRMHGKWAVFDDREVVIGSTNWSGQGLNQNLGTGKRSDYELNTERLEEDIAEHFDSAKYHEEKLDLPPMEWDGSADSYKELKERRKIFSRAIEDLKNKGEATIKLDGKDYKFKYSEEAGIGLEEFSELNTIYGYYDIIKDWHNSKETYKRGNNEVSIVFESPKLAKQVFDKQFKRDYDYSESKYETIKNKTIPVPQNINYLG